MDDVYVLYQIIGSQMHVFERYGTRKEAMDAGRKELKGLKWAVVLERVVYSSHKV